MPEYAIWHIQALQGDVKVKFTLIKLTKINSKCSEFA